MFALLVFALVSANAAAQDLGAGGSGTTSGSIVVYVREA